VGSGSAGKSFCDGSHSRLRYGFSG
jgi:CDGSH-type Zn-finger protein